MWEAALQHGDVRPPSRVIEPPYLDLVAQPLRIGVNDQRTSLATDVENHAPGGQIGGHGMAPRPAARTHRVGRRYLMCVGHHPHAAGVWKPSCGTPR